MELGNLTQPWIEIGRRLHAAGIFCGTQGSMSQRFPEGTRSGDGEMIHPGAWMVSSRDTHKATIGQHEFTLLGPDGWSLAGGEPTLEWRMHETIYRIRPDVQAIVHAHPVHATALAVAGIALPGELLAELSVDFGSIPLIPFGAPGTTSVGEAIETYIGGAYAGLLEQHGAITLGATPEEASARMERLERGANIYVVARLLVGGAPRSVTSAQIAQALAAAGQRRD